MRHVLPLLIENARAARDRQSASLAQGQLAQRQAEATLEQLRQFRAEYVARSPALTLGRTDAQALSQYHRFFSRLDEAIALQRQETVLREARVATQQALLVQCHQRLLAFETLARRLAAEREARELHRLQYEADEFAARAAVRAAREAVR